MRNLLLACVAVLNLAAAPPPLPAAEAPAAIDVRQDGLVGALYRPAVQGAAPAVLLLGGSEGGLGAGAARMARELSAHGYVVLHLGYFGAPGLPATLADVPVEYFTGAIAWLKRQPGVDGGRIALVGASKGAEAALLVAARSADVKAVVAAMPSNVAWPSADPAAHTSSWSEGGKPVAYLPYGWHGQFTGVYDLYKDGLADLAAHPEAEIPVERIAGPVLLISAGEDKLWPSAAMAAAIERRLKAKGFRYPVQHLSYAAAGHAGFGAPLSEGDPRVAKLGTMGGTPEGNRQARADGWAKMLGFLDAALRRPDAERPKARP